MSQVAQILPVILGWVGCYCLTLELAARKHVSSDWRLLFAFASAGWGTLVTGVTEILSLAQWLTPAMVWLFWIGIDVALFGTAILNARQRGLVVREELKNWWRRVSHPKFGDWPWDARCYAVVTGLLMALLFCIALIFPTTNWDSLNYHLPRVLHWAQQQSVEHFPTNNTRHIEFGPWSGFASLTLYLLWGGDRLSNLVQWHAMAGCIVLIPFIANGLVYEHGDSAQRRRKSAFACLFAVTLPIGIVQCMNPQNDYTATFWLCCLACFALMLWREPNNSFYMAGAGLACGLGTLTKATIYVYAAPLIIGFAAWWVLRRLPMTSKMRMAGIFCGAFVTLNIGHMARNFSVFGSPLGSSYIVKIERNARITASGTAANVVRNLSLHSNTGLGPLTRALNAGFGRAHALTGRDYKDPEITYHNPGHFRLYDEFAIFDSYAPSPYHVLLTLMALTIAACHWRQHRNALLHAAWIVASFILFCAFLKWQFWHTRLHLAYILLLAPIVGWVLVERLARWSVTALAAGLVGIAAVCLAINQSRPFFDGKFTALPREKQHLAVHLREMLEPTERLAETIVKSGCKNVGLKLDFDSADEYPLWVMLRNRGFKGVVQHVYVQNESGRIPARFIEPEVVVVSQSLGTPGPALTQRYPASTQFGNLTLMSRISTEEFSQR